MADKHPFLSDEWVTAAREVYDEFRGKTTPPTAAARINLVITDVPFGADPVNAHLDTSQGETEIDLGHLDNADATLTTDYATAQAMIFDPTSGMQAFMAGKAKVQGDLTKLMLLVQNAGDPVAAEVAGRIKEITA